MSLTGSLTLATLLTALLLAACGGATAPPSGTPLPYSSATVSVEGNKTNDNLVALISRLSDDRFPLVQHTQLIPEPTVIIVGGLPGAMPFMLPLPAQTVILGSVTHKNSLRGDALILLDVSQTRATIAEFYRVELGKQGFTAWNPGGTQSFQSASAPLVFCQRDKVIQLELDVYETPGKPADVRLSYYTSPLLVSCNQDNLQMTTEVEGILPNLTVPANTVIVGQGSGAGYVGWAYSQRNILTAASPADLDKFLRPQLEQAGWQLVAESHSDPVAWSKWTRTDTKGQRWSGVLIITAGQGSQNSRVLLFQIERVI